MKIVTCANEKEILEICKHENSMDILNVISENKIEMKGILSVKDNLKDALFHDQDIKKWIFFRNIFQNFGSHPINDSKLEYK